MFGHVVCVGLLYATFCLAYSRKDAGLLVAGCVIGFVLNSLVPVGPVVWFTYFGFAATAGLCWLCKARTRRFAAIACGIPLGVYGIAFAEFYPQHREVVQLRAEYPVESMATRLSHEDGKRSAVTPVQPHLHGEETLSPRIAGEVQRFEEELSKTMGAAGHLRERSLRRLYWTHSHVVQEFVQSQGFGIRRGIRVPAQHRYIDLPELPVVPYPSPAEAIDTASLDQVGQGDEPAAAAPNAILETPADLALRDFHETSAAGFSNPAGFGFVVDREHVLGFQSHGFRELPQVHGPDNRREPWQITSIELVSLLKHEPAAAYITKSLPRMDEIIDAPTRPLDSFETQSLEKLRAGDEIVVEREQDELRMFGSLRAARQCSQCHSSNRGDLLGAFTYRLRREGTLRRQPAQSAKPVL
jgi:hypothetical protein